MTATPAPARSFPKQDTFKEFEVRSPEVSNKLAQSLMRSKSAATFLRRQGGQVARGEFLALKREVDRLAGCDLHLASRLADRVGELAGLVGDPLASGVAEAGRARVLDQQGRHTEANAMFETAATRLRAAGYRREAAMARRQQVHSLFCLNRYKEALAVARTARRAFGEGDSLEVAQLEANVGNVYYRLERYKKALEHYDTALSGMAVDDEVLRAPTEFNRANILFEIGHHREAMTLLEKVAQVFERAGHNVQANQALFHIAYLHFRRGNFNTALASFYKVRDRLSELGSQELVAYCNQDIAEILLALNAFDHAIEAAAVARSHFQRLGMAYEAAQAATAVGLAAMGLGKFDDAEENLLEALDVFARTRNTILTALVQMYLAELGLKRGNYGEALRRANASCRVFARHKLTTKLAYARTVAGRAAYRLGALSRAERIARSAVDAAKESILPSVGYQCHHLIGMIQRARERRAEARASFMRAVQIVERARSTIAPDEFKSSFLKDKIEIYEDAINACLDEGTDELVDEAFRLVESAKSRALAELLARYARRRESGSQSQIRGAEPGTRARLLKLIEDLSWYSSQADIEEQKGTRGAVLAASRYRKKIAGCERKVSHLFQRLQAEERMFAEVGHPPAASTSELRDALRRSETAIEYFITGDEISAFVVTRDDMKVARNIASRRGVEPLLVALRFQLEKFGYNGRYVETHSEQLKQAIDECLLRLYEAIFEPLELMIAGDRLIVIPHGLLHYVPFQGLWDGREYLIDVFEISHAPSAAVLKLCRARDLKSEISNLKSGISKSEISNLEAGDSRTEIADLRSGNLKSQISNLNLENPNHSNGTKLVAVGVVEPDTPDIDEEIRALVEIFPRAVKLTGERATRDNLIRFAPGARLLHIASHASFRADNPMFSFLKLADSHLNFYSLLDLKLNAELVTLSACQTGLNAIFPGDELHGLMRGFLSAGASSLVVSMWRVNDRSTSELMSEMYKALRAGASKREALRQAQLRVKDKYPHPYYWAPFILMGNPI